MIYAIASFSKCKQFEEILFCEFYYQKKRKEKNEKKKKNIIHYEELTQIARIAYGLKIAEFSFYSTPCANIMTRPGSVTRINKVFKRKSIQILIYYFRSFVLIN